MEAFLQPAAPGEAEDLGGQGGHFADGFFQRQHAVFAHIAAQHAGERAPEARMGLRAGDAV